MNSNITLEKMTEEHIPALAQIEKSCFSKPWSEDAFKAELSNAAAVFTVAVCGGRTIGYIGFHTVLDEAYIANIAVSPDMRRMGAAKMLLWSAVKYCTERKMAFLSLEVRKSNRAAISLYEKFNFKIVGERKNFYSAPTENAYIMTLGSEDFPADSLDFGGEKK